MDGEAPRLLLDMTLTSALETYKAVLQITPLEAVYLVNIPAGVCTCPYHILNRGLCKHIIACFRQPKSTSSSELWSSKDLPPSLMNVTYITLDPFILRGIRGAKVVHQPFLQTRVSIARLGVVEEEDAPEQLSNAACVKTIKLIRERYEAIEQAAYGLEPNQLQATLDKINSLMEEVVHITSESVNAQFSHGSKAKRGSVAAKRASAASNHISAREGRGLKRTNGGMKKAVRGVKRTATALPQDFPKATKKQRGRAFPAPDLDFLLPKMTWNAGEFFPLTRGAKSAKSSGGVHSASSER